MTAVEEDTEMYSHGKISLEELDAEYDTCLLFSSTMLISVAVGQTDQEMHIEHSLSMFYTNPYSTLSWTTKTRKQRREE